MFFTLPIILITMRSGLHCGFERANPLDICPVQCRARTHSTALLRDGFTAFSACSHFASHHFRSNSVECCQLFIDNPTTRIGESWGRMPVSQQQRWKALKCDSMETGELNDARALHRYASCAVRPQQPNSSAGCRALVDARTPDGVFLQDIFLMPNGTVTALLNLREQQMLLRLQGADTHYAYQQYVNAKWACTTEHGDEAVAWTVGSDPSRYTLILMCKARIKWQTTVASSLQVAFKATFNGMSTVAPIFRATPCFGGSLGTDALSGLSLVGCTVERSADTDAIADWIDYHSRVGFDHFIVYVNGESSRVSPRVRAYIDNGKLTLLRWFWGDRAAPNGRKSIFMDQLSAQHDCVLRMRGRAKWVAVFDVDEYFQPMGTHKNVISVLHRYETHLHDRLGAVSAPSVNFGRCKGDPPRQRGDTVLKAYTCRHPRVWPHNTWKEKSIYRPERVQYMKVHRITRGAQTHVMDAVAEMRLAHFKKPENGPWFIKECARCKEKMFANTVPVRDYSLAKVPVDTHNYGGSKLISSAFGRRQGVARVLHDEAMTPASPS